MIQEMKKKYRYGLHPVVKFREQELRLVRKACQKKAGALSSLKLKVKALWGENDGLHEENEKLYEKIEVFKRYLKIEHPTFQLPGDAELEAELGLNSKLSKELKDGTQNH